MSIASRITSMENNIRNAYHGLDSIGIDTSSINKNIENISALLDDFYDTLPKVSGSGSNIQLTPTRKGRITSQINGDTFQQTYSGKNKINNNNLSYDYSNVSTSYNTLTTLPTGIRYTTTYDNGTPIVIFKLMDLTPYIGKTVRLKSIFGNGGTVRLGVCNSNVTSRAQKSTTSTSGETISYEVPNDLGEQKYLYYCIGTAVATASSVDFTDLILTIDDEDMTYEPYVGGQASPNPEFPQNIESVTGLQNISICGKNLFDKDNVSFTNGIYDDNGDYQASNSSWYTNNYYPVKFNTQYILSGTISVNGSPTRIYYYDKDKNWISRSASSSTNSITFTTPNNCKYIRIQVNNAISLNTGDVQLEKGSTATTYEAYNGETYDINLGDIELNKMDTQDYIIGTPNNWSIVKKIGTGTIIGSSNENYALRTDVSIPGYKCYRYSNFDYTLLGNIANGYSTHFEYSGSSNVANKFRYIKTSGFGIQFIISENLAPDVPNLKTWLSNNNVTFKYNLATPTTTPITDTTLINDLNNFYYAMSKNGETNISVDGNLPMILDVSALKGEE